MIKNLLIGILVSFTAGALFAQEAVDYRTIKNQEKSIDITPYTAEYSKLKIPQNNLAKDGGAETIFIGTSGNIYTILLEGNNQVDYNPDLNAVSFIHRKDDAAPLNGVMQYDYSTDGGATWEVNQGPLSPGFEDGTITNVGNGLRYPNGVLWAPEGSTSADDAYIVGHGPALSEGITAWGNIFEVSSKLDGTNVSENYANYAPPFMGENVDFHPYGTTNVNGKIWSLSTQINSTEDAANDTINNQVLYLTRGTFNDETFAFDYEVMETFTPNYVRILDETDNTQSNFVQNYSLTWGPDGMTGYVYVIGSEISELEYTSVPKPIVWKTTDGGETWVKRVEFDFQTLPAMQENLADANGGEVVRPFFTDTDCVVDSEGDLHLFSHVLSGFTNDPDSIAFIATGLETQFFYHVRTTGDTEWDADIISDVINSDAAEDFSLGDQALRFKPKATRTPDGAKVFFSYHKAVGNEILTSADIFARGYDIATDIYAAEKNLTEDTDYEEFTFYQTMSPVCIDGGECSQYELPIVFIEPGNDDLSSCQHVYLYGAGFDDINFDPSSVEDLQSKSAIKVYPNPSAGQFTVNVPKNETGVIQVTDLTGKEILSISTRQETFTIDLSDQPSGSYIIKFTSVNSVITESVIVR